MSKLLGWDDPVYIETKKLEKELIKEMKAANVQFTNRAAGRIADIVLAHNAKISMKKAVSIYIECFE